MANNNWKWRDSDFINKNLPPDVPEESKGLLIKGTQDANQLIVNDMMQQYEKNQDHPPTPNLALGEVQIESGINTLLRYGRINQKQGAALINAYKEGIRTPNLFDNFPEYHKQVQEYNASLQQPVAASPQATAPTIPPHQIDSQTTPQYYTGTNTPTWMPYPGPPQQSGSQQHKPPQQVLESWQGPQGYSWENWGKVFKNFLNHGVSEGASMTLAGKVIAENRKIANNALADMEKNGGRVDGKIDTSGVKAVVNNYFRYNRKSLVLHERASRAIASYLESGEPFKDINNYYKDTHPDTHAPITPQAQPKESGFMASLQQGVENLKHGFKNTTAMIGKTLAQGYGGDQAMVMPEYNDKHKAPETASATMMPEYNDQKPPHGPDRSGLNVAAAQQVQPLADNNPSLMHKTDYSRHRVSAQEAFDAAKNGTIPGMLSPNKPLGP